MFYGAAENVEKIQNRLRRKQYVQLDIFVDSIHVDHHYLWSDEEMICSKLRNEYFAQILRVHQMSQIESHHLEIDTVEKSRLYEEMKNGRETLESWARKLDEARSKQGFTTTKIVFEPAQISWEDDWMKFGKIQQNGLTTPLSKLPKTERERINLLSKTTIQLVLFFNDMEVSKTSWIPLETFLLPVMRRFELELYSPCQSCSFLVLEKQGAKVRQLGKADIPLPSDKDLEIALHEAEFECAQEMNPVGSSYGSNMIMKESGRILCRAILESGQLRVVDDRTNSGSFIDQKNDQRIQKFEVIPSELMLGSIQDEDDEKKRLDEIREDDRTQKKYKFRSAIDSRRLVSIRFANMSRQRVIDRRRRVEKTYEELVREQSIPTLSVAFSALFSQVDESRRLKPMRKEERAKNEGWQNTIVINIQSAINLPIRDNGQLQPFVIVKFGDEKQIKTDVAFGRHPNWQFTSKLIIEDNERNHEFIEIRVYDQIIDELDRDDRLHNIVYQQLTSRLLASAFIRFETLTNVSKINAPIRLKIPVYLSNYKISTESSFIKVLLSTQIPAISSSDCRHSSLSAENQKMLDKCGEFEKALRDPFPKRIIRPLVIDMNCKSTLCCRYLRAINPPTILMQENGDDHFQILTIAAQIISLMPRVKTISHSDVWSTIDQLTSIAVCGLEERAVLLACWLLHFRFPVKIVIGEACGEKTGFVQTEIDSKMWLIDPNDGSIYSNTDSNCPLQNISAAFDATNFYANVQEYHQTPQISLNFTRTALWRPLFSAGDEIPDSVQPSNVHYSRISEDWLLELRIGLEREIKLRFDEARSHAIPQWNLVAARQLREILEAPLTKNSHIEMIVDEKMSRLRDSYSINLSIFRIPYCSVQNCIDEILANKIHENPNSTAQFALAVHIIDFFAHVIRIDIAIASLKPKN